MSYNEAIDTLEKLLSELRNARNLSNASQYGELRETRYQELKKSHKKEALTHGISSAASFALSIVGSALGEHAAGKICTTLADMGRDIRQVPMTLERGHREGELSHNVKRVEQSIEEGKEHSRHLNDAMQQLSRRVDEVARQREEMLRAAHQFSAG